MLNFASPKGIEYMIMQSSESADTLIALFASARIQGYEDPYEIADEVFRQAGVNPEDLLENDRLKVNEAVSNLWRY